MAPPKRYCRVPHHRRDPLISARSGPPGTSRRTDWSLMWHVVKKSSFSLPINSQSWNVLVALGEFQPECCPAPEPQSCLFVRRAHRRCHVWYHSERFCFRFWDFLIAHAWAFWAGGAEHGCAWIFCQEFAFQNSCFWKRDVKGRSQWQQLDHWRLSSHCTVGSRCSMFHHGLCRLCENR